MDIDMTALRLVESEREIPLEVLVTAVEQALLKAYESTPDAKRDARVEIDRRTGHVSIIVTERTGEDSGASSV